jgi:hypothetical protein
MTPFDVPLHGSLSMKYRLRWNSDDRDQDLYEYLALDAGDPAADRVTAHAFVRLTEDIDGNRDHEGAYAYDSITDTFDHSTNGRLYFAYLDVRLDSFDLVRIGRQDLIETPVSLYFDGASLTSKPIQGAANLQFGAYGGIPVHLFESSTDGDSLVGAHGRFSPWDGAALRLDAIHVRDQYLFGRQADTLYGLGVRQAVATVVHLEYQQNFLSGENRDLLARAALFEPEWDLRAQVSYYRLVQTQKVVVTEFDYFFSVGGQYYPYSQGRILLSKGFGPHFVVEAGGDLRELENDDQEAVFNREFHRYYVTPSLSGWPMAKLTCSVTGEAWDVRHEDNGDLRTMGADLTYRCSATCRAAAGTRYELYKYDYLANEERDRVRTYWIAIKWAAAKDLGLDTTYEYEDGELDDHRTLKVGATLTF